MLQAIRKFGNELRSSSAISNKTVALFYYSGHGIQAKEKSYLLPVEVDIKNETDIEIECIEFSYVMNSVNYEGNKNSANIFILDSMFNGTSAESFMHPPTGTFIALSALPGQPAIESKKNGLFTSVLLDNIKTPGIDIWALFKKISKDVNASSNGKQTPWFSASLINNFYFTSEVKRPHKRLEVTVKEKIIPEKQGKYYALIIGNNDYKYLSKLLTAQKDAQEVANILKQKYGFQTELLLDVTREDIIHNVNNYRKSLKEDDNLLIYYAGHGVYDKSAGKAYWLPVDAKTDDDTNWIIVDTITSNLKRISSKHILIVADSCYSGTFTRGRVVQLDSGEERDRYLEKMLAKPSRTLMASGGNEPVSDIGGRGHSVFAEAFIQGLKNMEQRTFLAEELFYQNVKERVAGNAEQTPEYSFIRNSGHDGGDFVFKKLK